MSRWQWLAAILLVLVFVVALAPARLATQLVNQQAPDGFGIRLLQPIGTLWNGSADLIVEQYPTTRVAWRFQPWALLQLTLGVELELVGDGFNLQGRIEKPIGDGVRLADGYAHASSRALQTWLAPYDIDPSGELTIEALTLSRLRLTGNGALKALTSNGQANWSGGDLSYRLAGRTTQVALPPLTGLIDTLDELPRLRVTEKGKDLPLILGHLTPRNSISIGITQGFTRLAGQPWPGSEPDHKVVLEVEEPLI